MKSIKSHLNKSNFNTTERQALSENRDCQHFGANVPLTPASMDYGAAAAGGGGVYLLFKKHLCRCTL